MNQLTIFNEDDFIEIDLVQIENTQTSKVVDMYVINEISRHWINSKIKTEELDSTELKDLSQKLKTSSLEIFKVLYQRLGENDALHLLAEIDLTIKLAENETAF